MYDFATWLYNDQFVSQNAQARSASGSAIAQTLIINPCKIVPAFCLIVFGAIIWANSVLMEELLAFDLLFQSLLSG